MNARFFERPILNSPCEYPGRHWELDESGQPTSQIIDHRRRVSFITPIPKPKKRGQREIVFDETAAALETGNQQYELMEVINDLRRRVDAWRAIPDPGKWRVTPETARLLRHRRGHRFGGIRPFFCQVEEGIVGEDVGLRLEHLEEFRPSTLVFQLTKRLRETKWRDPGEAPKLHLFRQLKRVTRQWLYNSLQLVGEAATHVPAEVRDTHSEVHWRETIGTRNRIVHAYLRPSSGRIAVKVIRHLGDEVMKVFRV